MKNSAIIDNQAGPSDRGPAAPINVGHYSMVHNPMQMPMNGAPGPQLMQMQWNVPSPMHLPSIYGQQVYSNGSIPSPSNSSQYVFAVNGMNNGLAVRQVMPHIYGQQVFNNSPTVDSNGGCSTSQYACKVSNRYSSLEVEECELEGNVQSLPEINFETDEMTMINPREAEGLYCEEKERRKNLKRRVASPVSSDSIQMEREAPKRQFFHRKSDIQTTSGQVTESRNQPSVNLPQLEIPETEMICGSVIIKAVEQGAKFTNEYELTMFFKEKIKSRFNFEINGDGNIIFLHLKE